MTASNIRPTVSFWVTSTGLLLWSLGGASIYVAYFMETPDEFALAAEAAANRDAYPVYVANIPWWAIAVGIVAAAARLLGSVGLLLRRRWALPLFAASLAFFLVALYRAFVLASVWDVMSAPHIAVEFVFLTLSIFAIWFARRNIADGVLQ